MERTPQRSTKWHMITDAVWSDVAGVIRKREHFFWWPTYVTFWGEAKPFERLYWWKTVILTEQCRSSVIGNFWTVIAVDNETIA